MILITDRDYMFMKYALRKASMPLALQKKFEDDVVEYEKKKGLNNV